MSEAIEARALRKEFGGQAAVDGVTLSVERGEIFGLVGPDGAGKTTLMRMLCAILDPTSGDARVLGFETARRPEEIKRRIGYMSQRFSLYGDLTVDENIRFFANLHGVPRAAREERQGRLLAAARMEPFRDRLAQDLSGGMKQKLALTCTLIHTPEVLFLDEPTTGVDPVSRREFWRILYELHEESVTIMVSTPYMDEAERCRRLALMDRGSVLAVDTPAGLKAGMRGEIVEIVAEPQREAGEALARCPGVMGLQVFGDRLHVWVEEAARLESYLCGALSERGVRVVSHRAVKPGLEDVFVARLSSRPRGTEKPHE